MEGGNEVREANGITHSPERRTKRREAWIQKRRSGKPSPDVARIGLQLDGFAVKGNFATKRTKGTKTNESGI